MRELPRSSSPRWLEVGPDPKNLRVCTPVHYWYAHWDEYTRRSRKCGGQQCAFCNDGRPKEIRYVVGVVGLGRQRYLFELRPRHWPVVEELNTSKTEGVGALLRIQKKGTAKNSPVEVCIRDWEPTEEWDITALVAELGDAPLASFEGRGKKKLEELEHELTTT